MTNKPKLSIRVAEQGIIDQTIRVMGIMAALFAGLLCLGTFVDLPLANGIYMGENPLVIVLSTIGLLPMTIPLCIMLGALVQRAQASKAALPLRLVGMLAPGAFSLFCGLLLVRSLASSDGLGAILPMAISDAACLISGLIVGALLSWLGYRAAQGNDDKRLAARIQIIVLALVISFLCVEVIKGYMMRPRPRTLFLGLEGIEFYPWFRRCANAKELTALHDLTPNAFRSFPSGHCIQSACILTSLYGLSLLWEGLQRRWKTVMIVAVVEALLVMLCRMVLGAHFLSDVSFSSLMAALFGLGAMVLERRVGASK